MVWDAIGRSYDQVAKRYEARFVDELSVKPRDRELLDAFAHATGDPVLELGCGPGQVGSFVRHCGRVVIGLDLSAEMAALAVTRLDAAMTGDIRRLPIASASVGGVVAFYSFIHLPRHELPLALHEVARVLRPGGRVLFAVHEGVGEIEREEFLDVRVPFVASLFQLDELVAATDAAGLTVAATNRRPPVPDEAQTFRLYVEAFRPGTV